MWYHTQVDTTSGRLAQLVEHLLDVQEVTGSSPVPSTIQFVPEPDSLRKGSGIFLFYKMFSMPRVCRTVSKNEQRQGIIMAMVPCLLCYMAHWGQSLRTCVPGACTPLTRCNTLDFVPKSVCQGAVSRLSARSSASKCKHFEVATGDPRPLESLRSVYARTQRNG